MKNSTKGFTIIESLVAITILVAAVIGTTRAIQSGLSSYIFAKDQITAYFLAQEGFEQLRNIRDENSLNARHWLAGIAQLSSDPCHFGPPAKACTVSPIESTGVIACSAPGSCPMLRQNATSGFYGYNAAWPVTRFRREIQIELVNANEISTVVTVYWSKGILNRSFRVKENILNWQAGI